jgi:hypothetical protein
VHVWLAAFFFWSLPVQASNVVLAREGAQMEALNTASTLTPREKSVAIAALYRRSMAPIRKHKSSLSDRDVHALFKAANTAFFYAMLFDVGSRDEFFNDVRGDQVELERRGVLRDEELSDVYSGMIGLRKLDEAKEFARRHAQAVLPAIPPVTKDANFEPRRLAVFDLASDQQSLHLHNIDIDERNLIVIVAHCHFARDAAAQIASDPVLMAALDSAHVIWLQGSSEPLDIDAMKAWNTQFPRQRLSVAYDNQQWPRIDFSSSPEFFFFKDGRLVSRRDGWSSNTSMDALVESLAAMGISVRPIEKKAR